MSGCFFATIYLFALLVTILNGCRTGASSNIGCILTVSTKTNGNYGHRPRDCAEVQKCGATESGVYLVHMRGGAEEGVAVYCDLKTAGGGWTVFQRRLDGSVDFFQGWENYRLGFGDISGEYWLGNDKLHILTMQKRYKLYVYLEDWTGKSAHALYTDFFISGAQEKYKLYVSGYSGTAGDSFSAVSGMKFSTKEADHDTYPKNCAIMFKGAWWYSKCHASNLNGWYFHNGAHKSRAVGVNWLTFKGFYHSLKKVKMMVRPFTFKP